MGYRRSAIWLVQAGICLAGCASPSNPVDHQPPGTDAAVTDGGTPEAGPSNAPALEVLNVSPAHGATDVDVNAPVHITFNQPVDAASLENGCVRLEKTGNPVDVSAHLAAPNLLSLSAETLTRESTYTVVLCPALRPTSGGNLGVEKRFSFTVVPNFRIVSHHYDKGSFNPDYGTDYSAAFSDRHDDQDVALSAWIVVDFSVPIDPSSVDLQQQTAMQRNPETGTFDAFAEDVDRQFTVSLVRTRIGKTDVTGDYNDPKLMKHHVVQLEVVELRNNGRRLVLKPLQQYFPVQDSGAKWRQTSVWGIKPACTYRVSLAGLRDSQAVPQTLSTDATWTFTTVNVDWGLYFMSAVGSDGYTLAEKLVPGRPNAQFNPDAPTVAFAHGFKTSVVNRDYRREAPRVYSGKHGAVGSDNLATVKQAGWNVGYFEWGQVCDEEGLNIKDAEAKCYNADARDGGDDNGRYGMRYRVQVERGSDEFMEVGTPGHVGPRHPLSVELAYQWVAALHDSPVEKRLVGHSTGGNVITGAAAALSEWAMGSNPDWAPRPVDAPLGEPLFHRITYLDPFWSTGTKDYLQGRFGQDAPVSTGELARFWVDTLKQRHRAVGIEHYKFQDNLNGDGFGSLPLSDANKEFRRRVCGSYVYPRWLVDSTATWNDPHEYAPPFYFGSYGLPLDSQGMFQGGLTMASPVEVILAHMNSGTDGDGVFVQTRGATTKDLEDNAFGWKSPWDAYGTWRGEAE